jgi:hypothetical protein
MTKGIDECMGVSELKSLSDSSWKPEFVFGDKVMFYADRLSLLLSSDDKFHLEMKAIIEWVLFPQREFKQIPSTHVECNSTQWQFHKPENQQPPAQHEGWMVGGFDTHPTLVII